jgi:EpsI family protein
VTPVLRWVPALLLGIGVLLMQSVGRQQPMPLAAPLSEIPRSLEGLEGYDLELAPWEQRVAGMDSYVARAYRRPHDSSLAFTLYVGYYESQTQGRTIHSPRNCLPGAGWEAVAAEEIRVQTAAGAVPINRYVIANKDQQALVYYWYQGRGRVSANEYRVKWELLRDAAVRRRTDEALVRILVPIRTTVADAEALATPLASHLVPAVFRLLPH